MLEWEVSVKLAIQSRELVEVNKYTEDGYASN